MSQQILKFAVAFKATQDGRGVGTTALSEESGIHKSRIFEFRRQGTGVSLEKLEQLLDAMERLSPGAFAEYSRRLADAPLDVSQLTQDEIADLMLAIGVECKKRNASGGKQATAMVA